MRMPGSIGFDDLDIAELDMPAPTNLRWTP
jgi:hypothetical protein